MRHVGRTMEPALEESPLSGAFPSQQRRDRTRDSKDAVPSTGWRFDRSPLTIARMRLSDRERQLIREAGLRHFGVAPRLFGSRLDDARGGGDIDLLIRTDLPPAEAARRRLDLLADLWLALGERKIDIVLDDGSAPHGIVERARRDAVPV